MGLPYAHVQLFNHELANGAGRCNYQHVYTSDDSYGRLGVEHKL